MNENKSSGSQVKADHSRSTNAGSATDSGDLTTQQRPVGPFTQVENDTMLPVFIVDGAPSVAVTVDSSLQSRVLTTVKNGVLTITTSGFIREIAPGSQVQLSVTDLAGITLKGSGPLSAQVTPAANLALNIQGDGVLSFSGTAQAVNAQVSGSGGVHLDGAAQSLNTQLQGSGYVDARRLPVSGAATLVNQGSGPLTATANGTVSIDLKGSGLITWFGSAKVISQSRTGSGLIIHLP